MKSIKMNCDLKVETTNLPDQIILKLIRETVTDGFSVIALCQTLPLKTNYNSYNLPDLKKKYLSTYSETLEDTLILNRVNWIVEDPRILSQRTNNQMKSTNADLISYQFKDPEVLEKVLKLYSNNSIMNITNRINLGCSDHLFFIDLQDFQVPSRVVKLLSQKGVFVEFGYSQLLINSEKQQTAFINFFKLVDSQIKNLILSSSTGKPIFKRSVRDVYDLFSGLLARSEARNQAIANKLLFANPLYLLKMSKLKREGVVQVLK